MKVMVWNNDHHDRAPDRGIARDADEAAQRRSASHTRARAASTIGSR
jgi:hypothetical protein